MSYEVDQWNRLADVGGSGQRVGVSARGLAGTVLSTLGFVGAGLAGNYLDGEYDNYFGMSNVDTDMQGYPPLSSVFTDEEPEDDIVRRMRAVKLHNKFKVATPLKGPVSISKRLKPDRPWQRKRPVPLKGPVSLSKRLKPDRPLQHKRKPDVVQNIVRDAEMLQRDVDRQRFEQFMRSKAAMRPASSFTVNHHHAFAPGYSTPAGKKYVVRNAPVAPRKLDVAKFSFNPKPSSFVDLGSSGRGRGYFQRSGRRRLRKVKSLTKRRRFRKVGRFSHFIC